MTGSLPRHAATLPVVGISANVRQLADFKFQGAADKVLHAVFEAAGCLPMMLPALGERYNFADIISRLDGIVLTGAISHVDPALYGEDAALPAHLQDKARDATTLPLIRHAVTAGLPLLAICRGMQELNVAFGGKLKMLADKEATPHRDNGLKPVEEWLEGTAHQVSISQDGTMAAILTEAQIAVNSAHEQAIGELAPRLRIEALADDGVVEAVSVKDSAGFTLGVQWHPEYGYEHNASSQQIFAAFGQAARARLGQRYLQADWEQSIIDETMFSMKPHV